jgi:hypothetical protein
LTLGLAIIAAGLLVRVFIIFHDCGHQSFFKSQKANLDLQIKRDGKGVPLPLAQQDVAQLSRIQGFVPHIIEIKPATSLSILSELRLANAS